MKGHFMLEKFGFHPIADLFPLMAEAEISELAEDIKKNGLAEPILIYEDKILDGRNRYLACEKVGIKPESIKYGGKDPLGLVISLNLKRRHLNESQRGMIAAKIANMSHGGDRKSDQAANLPLEKVSQSNAAKLLNVSERGIRDAKEIIRKAPEKVKDIESGKKTIHQVKREMRKEKTREILENATIPKEKEWIITDNQKIINCKLIITDPPYGITDQPWEPKPENLEKFTRSWLTEWVKAGAEMIFIFWSQEYMWKGKNWFDESLGSKYKFQQLLIWHYPNNKSPQSREGFKQTWEPIFFYRSKKSDRKIKISSEIWGAEMNDFDCHVSAVPQSNFNDAEMKIHPAQKPVSVFRWIINASTLPGELVCDPFCGSGASGIAAIQLKRKYHGIEIDPKYVKLANQRIATYGK